MKFNSDFRHDLEVGQLGEKALANLLENKKIEVKTDLMAQRTGNIFIEYQSRGKPSGVSTSQADYWCFIISKHHMIILSLPAVKQIARQNWGRRCKGGDSNTSQGVLVPINALLRDVKLEIRE